MTPCGPCNGIRGVLVKDGLYWDNGKEHGNYYSIVGLYGDTGKENETTTIVYCGLGNSKLGCYPLPYLIVSCREACVKTDAFVRHVSKYSGGFAPVSSLNRKPGC